MHSLNWKPVATRQAIEARAALNASIRAFFTARNVLEVETPILAQAGVPDLHLVNATTELTGAGLAKPQTYYLQTSPEFAMKRLLAAGIGDCFQLARVVRNDELSRRHNFEFTLLEWYRLNFTDHDLMHEIDALMQYCLQVPPAEYVSYQTAFQQALECDPLSDSAERIARQLTAKGIDCDVVSDNKQALLHLAMSLVVEPSLNPEVPTFVTFFPKEQAALARLNENDPRVAHRFELFYKGLELANGFWELTCASEQRARFEQDNRNRKAQGLPEIPIDERLLAALEQGLPPCAGVAVGVDRLLMIQLKALSIEETLCFPSLRA